MINKNKYLELFKYAFWGVVTTIFSIIVFSMFNQYFSYQISNFISWLLSVLFAYFVNSSFVFSEKFKFVSLVKFYFSRIFSYLLEVLLLFLGVEVFNKDAFFVKVVATIFVTIVNYFFAKFLIFDYKE